MKLSVNATATIERRVSSRRNMARGYRPTASASDALQFSRTYRTGRAYHRRTLRDVFPGSTAFPARCHVAKGQVKVSKNNKPKLTVKEKFAKKAMKKAMKAK